MKNGTEYCVLWTSGGRELELERKLRELQYAIYCPTIERTKRSRYDRNRTHKVVRPLYPGYLFCGMAHALQVERAATLLKIKVQLLRQTDALLVLNHEQMMQVCEAEYSQHEAPRPLVQPTIPEVTPPASKQTQGIHVTDMVQFIEGLLTGQRGTVTQLRRDLARVDLYTGHGSVTVPVAVLRLYSP